MNPKQKKIEHNKDFPNSGVLFQKDAEGKQPNSTGILYIAGDVLKYILQCDQDGKDVVLDLSAWNRVSKAGNSFQSLAVSKPWSPPEKEYVRPKTTQTVKDMTDDIPF